MQKDSLLVIDDLRHTFAFRLAQTGIDPYTIQKLMGHKTFTNTQRYALHYSESLKIGIKALEASRAAQNGRPLAQWEKRKPPRSGGRLRQCLILLVPAVGIEPTRSQAPRDFECENRVFSNPLILVRFSRNRSN